MEERKESDDLKLPYLLLWPTFFPVRCGWWFNRENMLKLEAEKTERVGRMSEEKIIMICLLEKQAERQGRLQPGSATHMDMRLGIGFGTEEGMVKICS